ncbi:monocarboxylate transporter 10-like [Lytechinus variegatus]|uniref:monocarboxylate transporter 10-like n=1 Tax=Lytechinus variegatus TaxID=7654 RepID=UPI001BB1C690|nr:monocarboxylate transporter 10-like [Lytechinus variegatus]
MTRRSVPTSVPEGGWGWIVCLASCWTNGVVFGVINSFGVLYVVMLELEGADAFKTSWIGAVCAGLTFFMSPFASIITDKLGCRPAAVIGSALALAGVLASSFATKIEHMYITYGFAMGLGFAIAYQPSLYILGIYFQKRLGVANGLVTFGSAIFTIVLPIAMREILNNHGLGPCLWFQSSIIFVMLVGSLTFRPRPEAVEVLDLKEDYTSVQRTDDDSDLQENIGCCRRLCRRLKCSKCSCSSIIDVSIWKERNYRIWAIGVPLGLFGYFVPFFHLVKHVNDTLPEARAEVLIMCLGATSGLGRLVSGFLSDHPKINPVYIQQIAFLVIGVSTTLMPVIRNFIGLCILILIMGVFDGAFVSMMGPIAFNLVGPQRASQAIGSVLGLMSIPMMIGPPVAGLIYDMTGTYTIAFICSGVPPIVTACILFLLRPDSNEKDVDGEKIDAATEKEREAMMPQGATSAMATKEMEAMMGNDSRDEMAGIGRLRGGSTDDAGFDDRRGLEDDRGRRRSYRRDILSPSDTRIIMEKHDSHSNGNHHPNGVRSNGEIYRYAGVFTEGFGSKGVLANAYGLEEEGSRSPYAQRNRNQSNHHGNQNGRVHKGNKFEMNGIVHRIDSHTDELGTMINIMDRETTV